MSRLIVKNLPKSITEERLRKVFGARGCVTDCQLKYTKDGVFRRFAFIGYQTEIEAEFARKHMDMTFIDSFKIQVETCKPFGDETKPRAWSKYSKDSSAFKRQKEEEKKETTLEETSKPAPKAKSTKATKTHKEPADARFEEFMDLAGKKPKGANSGNEIDAIFDRKVEDPEASTSQEDLESQLLKQKPPSEKHFLIIHGLPTGLKLKNLKEFVAPVRLKTVKVAKGEKLSAVLVSFQRSADLRRLLKRNGEFFGKYKLEIKKLPADMRQTEKEEDTEEGAPISSSVEASKELELIADTGRLFVRNLSYLCSTEDLEALFKEFGPLTDITMPIDKRQEKPKGYAVVTFMMPEHAVKAFTKLDGTVFQGRMLHIIGGKEKPGDEKEAKKDANANLSEFKKKKIAALKAVAGKSHNWNSLFLGGAAVADALAVKLDTEKSAILDSGADASLGVRMALGETRLVKETREFLMSHGVALDSFSRPDAPRSKTVILVKNLPARTKPEQLKKVFEAHGEVARLVLPSIGVTGLVEYLDGGEAKKAFEALAYSRFASAPLYLEWAPGDVFSGAVVDPDDEKEDEDNDETAEKTKEKNEAKPIEDGTEAGEDDRPEPETELFVKNLNFETTDDGLRKKFERMGPLYYATVAKKTDPKNPGHVLSMGFGFVQFMKREDTQKALKNLQGITHKLDEQFVKHEVSEFSMEWNPNVELSTTERKGLDYLEQGDSTKIMVRNIPFQASQKEIRELFAAFGDIRSIRLPKKIGGDSAHRGFAFVDFTTKATARRVFKSLCHSTHLYGRRLVLEWAKEDETLEDVRKRTADHFKTGDQRVKRAKEKKIFLNSLNKAAGM